MQSAEAMHPRTILRTGRGTRGTASLLPRWCRHSTRMDSTVDITNRAMDAMKNIPENTFWG
jgi:hypothetical protein